MSRHEGEAPIFIVTGAGRFSLGATVVEKLASLTLGSEILAIDVESLPLTSQSVSAGRFNLNPLDHNCGFESWSAELHGLIASLPLCNGHAASGPVRGLFLGAAKYQVGKYEQSTATERAAILGCNVLGKWEVLHAAMRRNADLGFDNGQELAVFDVGSFHGLRHSAHRALYTPTKAAGLELCRVLMNGSEVRRAVHLAPGPIDTPMLHWNHWTLKEHGDPGFPALVRERCPSLYLAIFRDGDPSALAAAQRELQVEDTAIRDIFARYVHRRALLAQTDDGITNPEILAEYIANAMLEEGGNSGVVEVSSPSGHLRIFERPF